MAPDKRPEFPLTETEYEHILSELEPGLLELFKKSVQCPTETEGHMRPCVLGRDQFMDDER